MQKYEYQWHPNCQRYYPIQCWFCCCSQEIKARVWTWKNFSGGCPWCEGCDLDTRRKLWKKTLKKNKSQRKGKASRAVIELASLTVSACVTRREKRTHYSGDAQWRRVKKNKMPGAGVEPACRVVQTAASLPSPSPNRATLSATDQTAAGRREVEPQQLNDLCQGFGCVC